MSALEIIVTAALALITMVVISVLVGHRLRTVSRRHPTPPRRRDVKGGLNLVGDEAETLFRGPYDW